MVDRLLDPPSDWQKFVDLKSVQGVMDWHQVEPTQDGITWGTATLLESSGEIDDCEPAVSLRQMQIELMMKLPDVVFGRGAGRELCNHAIRSAKRKCKAEAEILPYKLHYDELAQMVTELNVALEKPEWNIPFFRS
ncbi:hypothetical protein FPZ24_01950 [Sphingomonas panacisoli]|uniref:Uncharacterized protein n=1 Tax=Sphingomonas panacisoli TaxID=1813879 RepID=A0A5B8LE42_9SPHN|nr:hypothetical protein [Sphingomonas panacisoli]QDZ06387.1 hypothetical protein FPZ24_01950 [Sphingomonas panacisoli]